MSVRESVIKKIEIIPEELLQRVIEVIGMYGDEAEEPIIYTDELRERINAGLQRGMDDIKAGRITSSADVKKEMQELYKKHGV
jgi:hypothetical protein